MFIFNFKLNSSLVFKLFFICAFTVILVLSILAIYNTVTQLIEPNSFIHDDLSNNSIKEIEPSNYSNILKEVHENVNTYIGQKISFSGFVYRVPDLTSSQFILARNMRLSESSYSNTVVIGFLCEYPDAQKFQNNCWIKITGTIEKTDYHGEIPYIKISTIEECSIPNEPEVKAPDETYIPTSIIF